MKLQTVTNDINILYNNKFKLILNAFPNLAFFCTSVQMPSIDASSITKSTPFGDLHVTASKVSYSPISIIFKVDEDLNNYMELFKWITTQTISSGYDKHNEFISKQSSRVSSNFNDDVSYTDGTLMTTSNVDKKNVSFKLIDMGLIHLGGIEFTNSDETPMICSAIFNITNFIVEK